MGQVLFANGRIDAVGGHEQIRRDATAVFKMRADGTLRSFFIAQKSLVELHFVFKTRQQDAPQGDAADRPVLSYVVSCAASPAEAEKLVQLLGDYAEALRKAPTRGTEKIPQVPG